VVVYFLRHAEAAAEAENDFDRELTPKGLEQAEKVSRFLLRTGIAPGVILSSPVARALETARILARNLGDAEVIESPWLACGMASETCLRELRGMQNHDSVLLTGHEPDFSEAIACFIGLDDPDGLKIRKASLTAVDMPQLKSGSGRLDFSIPCRLM